MQSGKTQPKKLTISLKNKPQLPSNYQDETWKKLQAACRAVHSKQPVTATLEDLYKSVENLVDHQMGDVLYKNLEQEIDEHSKTEYKRISADIRGASLEQFLIVTNTCWTDYCDQLLLIRSIFLYLDRKFTLQKSEFKSIWDLGLNSFGQKIARIPDFALKLREALLHTIEADRKGESVDKNLLKNLLRMLSALGLYTNHFEKYFLDSTANFYQNESDRYLQELQIEEFLKYIERRLNEENERVLLYLDEQTRKDLISTVEKVTLARHVDAIIEKGIEPLVDGEKKEDLKRMYTLLQRVQSLQKLKDAWNKHLKKRGSEIVLDEQRDDEMIPSLLKFKRTLDDILLRSFEKQEDFVYAQKDAFEYFINVRQNTPAELLAKFVDANMRTGKERRAVSDAELDSLLDQVMEIFRFINSKDVFEAFYKKDLSKRLLLSKSSSIDGEKAFISKLKIECGANFTSKLEGMFKDIELSKDINETFRSSPEYNEKCSRSVDSRILVLTMGFWPPFSVLKCNLPPLLSEFQNAFQQFYLNKNPGRRLIWMHSQTQCTLKALFPKGRKELSTSLFQAIVLMTFNEGETKSFQEILAITNLDPIELKKTLASLVSPKVRILTKSSTDNKINDTDTFTFRRDFASKSVRLQINFTVQVKERKEEQAKTQEIIFRDRQYQVDAAIVRIMKTRKDLTHNQLISELYAQIKFPAKAADLKKRIESLIERDYLERDSNDANLYHYLA